MKELAIDLIAALIPRYLSRALDSAFCRLVEAAGKGNLTAMLRQ